MRVKLRKIVITVYFMTATFPKFCVEGMKVAEFDIKSADVMQSAGPSAQTCSSPDTVELSNEGDALSITAVDLPNVKTFLRQFNGSTTITSRFYNMRILVNPDINGTTIYTVDGKGTPLLADSYFVNDAYDNVEDASNAENKVIIVRQPLMPSQQVALSGTYQNFYSDVQKVPKINDAVNISVADIANFFNIKNATNIYYYLGNYTLNNTETGEISYHEEYVYAETPENTLSIPLELYQLINNTITGSPVTSVESNNPQVYEIFNTIPSNYQCPAQ